MNEVQRAILEEFQRRKTERSAVTALVRRIRAELFDKQLAFLDDPSRNKAALCTRRAGKTSMWVRYTTAEALTKPRVLIRIWAVNRLRAKQLLWDEFVYLFKRHGINAKLHETELTIKFDNGSEIRLLGADKDKEVQKKRGDKTWMEIVLEAQGFGPYLKSLVEDVAEPCLFDLKGTFCLEGTPGPVCAGYWHDVTGRDNVSSRWQSVGSSDGIGTGWSVHRWSVLDNPFLPHAAEELAELKKKRRWGDEHPTYVREWTGRWVNDIGALFYKFNPTRNVHNIEQPWGPGWTHVLGWDLGFRDDMALVAWGWHPDHPGELYEAYSWKKPGALDDEVMEQVTRLEGLGFNFIEMVADTGGGGRMYVEAVARRFGRSFNAAKKTEKYEHVRLLNDDLLTGHIKLRPGSPLLAEMVQLPTDPDWPDPTKPEAPPTEDPRFPNHCCDAGLYAFRAAWHYVKDEVKPQKPDKHSREYVEKYLEAELSRRKRDWLEQLEDTQDEHDFFFE